MPSTQPSVFEQPRRKSREGRINGPIEVDGIHMTAHDCGAYIACTKDVPRGTPRPKSIHAETPVPNNPHKRRWWVFLFCIVASFTTVMCLLVYAAAAL